ncbi:MAG: cation:proton antiporter [Hadesarchaea archaeon]|jgi:Kef-type K+ transport system membrane component KefB|nr:cation:proton antiporter [Hadesarchaea archaeon]
MLAGRARMPPILGEILAGLLVGPSVAGSLSSHLGSRLCLDPSTPEGEWVGFLADLGILLLLFLAGLSLEWEELKASGRGATLTALGGTLWAFPLGFAAAHVMGWTSLEAAFAGGVLVATSVGISVGTLLDLHRLRSREGAVILGAAVIDDVFGIIVLSLLAGMAYGGLSVLGLVWTLLLMLAFFLLLFTAGPRLVPWLLSRSTGVQAPEFSLSLTLVLVLLISALAEKVRIAAITGAFLVGLLVGRSPLSRTLREKISVIGYGLLIPLFFAEVGLRTDLGALRGVGPGILLFLAASFLSKIGGCGLGALLGGLGRWEALRVGVGMMPRGEVALIVASAGLKVGAVGSQLFSMTVVTVFITSLLTPPLLKLVFERGPRAGYFTRRVKE